MVLVNDKKYTVFKSLTENVIVRRRSIPQNRSSFLKVYTNVYVVSSKLFTTKHIF